MENATTAAVVVDDIRKTFGRVQALDGVSLEVPAGSVLGLLGPNGAGKTTLVRILTTLLRPDSGRATVAGLDVVRDAAAVRAVIGLAGQHAAVDENLTGRENLVLVGRLYHLGRRESQRRAEELLHRFDLVAAADRRAKTYSGGMRRRLDLAASLVARPQVLFLDEPTTGLDPRSRLDLWRVIADLVQEGTTLLLTTQYLEEADRLADMIVVIDSGRVIARGTADELKSRAGGEHLEVGVSDPSVLPLAAAALEALTGARAVVDPASATVVVALAGGASVLADAVRVLDRADVAVASLVLRRPTLDDVFLALTGQAPRERDSEVAAVGEGPGRKTRRGSGA